MQRELSIAEATLELEITSLTGKVQFELFSQDGQHYIHSSEYPLFFTFSAYDYDRLASIDYRLISGDNP